MLAQGLGVAKLSNKTVPAVRNRVALTVRALVVVVALMLGGCSASEIVQGWTSGPTADLSQPNYRRIVADNIKTVFPEKEPRGPLEISGVRQVDHLKGPAWLTCLKLDATGNPEHYAIFIQDNKIIDARGNILVDGCHKQPYTPFDVRSPTKKSDT